MMNPNSHTGFAPFHGRRAQEISFNPQHHYTPNVYHYHPQHVPQQFHQPPPQWAYYNMQHPMPRPYQQPYPHMGNGPYTVGQTPSMSPRPPPQQLPTSSVPPYQNMLSPSPAQDRPTTLSQPSPPPSRISTPPAPPAASVTTTSFRPPLPWYSVPEKEFPKRRSRRRRMYAPQSPSLRVQLPARDDHPEHAQTAFDRDCSPQALQKAPGLHMRATPAPLPTLVETPTTSLAPSEENSTQPTTPISQHIQVAASDFRQPRKTLPIVPAVPILSSSSRIKKPMEDGPSDVPKSTESSSVIHSEPPIGQTETVLFSNDPIDNVSQVIAAESLPESKVAPKSWADLVRNQGAGSTAAITVPSNNGYSQMDQSSGSPGDSKANILSKFDISEFRNGRRISFLKPRGLINTGNMCYMNSVLQTLVFCTPFYDFLDQVGKEAAYSFKSDTPMLDAMIMFIREFPIIDSAASVEQLNMRLKDKELEEYGDAFIPEFVYDVIRRLPRFSSMRRGHQQDAEEFLGFLLEEMHEECVRAIDRTKTNDIKSATIAPIAADDVGWLEVGPKQKAAVTRSTGLNEVESPVTKIFGGKLRSEFRVPGAKNSVTLEPYQPLQLDIGAPQIHNIVEALKGLTRSETLHGDFNSPRGPGVHATKQVFVESLPPVLILHLKRFQYDNAGGTQKIWKKVGYPLELEIPKEVFPPHKRGAILAHGGLPKYRLIGVVYHHGKNASGGHYTVDVRRQNGREWIRLDDTIIRRVKSEDVAEAGGEEDPKILAAALEQHKLDDSASSHIFDQVRDEAEQASQAEKGWSQVNGGLAQPNKKWSGVVNGTSTPTNSSGKRTPVGHSSVKDNKVAYILFYQKVDH